MDNHDASTTDTTHTTGIRRLTGDRGQGGVYISGGLLTALLVILLLILIF